MGTNFTPIHQCKIILDKREGEAEYTIWQLLPDGLRDENTSLVSWQEERGEWSDRDGACLGAADFAQAILDGEIPVVYCGEVPANILLPLGMNAIYDAEYDGDKWRICLPPFEAEL